jgi:hypothetical protein
MKRQNAPYYRMWQDRYRPFLEGDWYLCMEFSPRYFEKLKQELESAGHEVTIDEDGDLYSDPVGKFNVNSHLNGESFVFFAV